MSLGAIVDAKNASDRLYHVFVAETLSDTHEQDEKMEAAIEVIDGGFTWDSAPPEGNKQKQKKGKKGSSSAKAKSSVTVTEKPAEGKQEAVFHMEGINLSIPKGQLTAIIGMYISFGSDNF